MSDSDDMIEFILAKEIEVKVTPTQARHLEAAVLKSRVMPSLLHPDPLVAELLAQIYDHIVERGNVLLRMSEALDRMNHE